MESPKRILTPMDRLQHIIYVKRKDDKVRAKEYYETIGDIASFETNRVHNPETGFSEFLLDTPLWIVKLAVLHKWASPENIF